VPDDTRKGRRQKAAGGKEEVQLAKKGRSQRKTAAQLAAEQEAAPEPIVEVPTQPDAPQIEEAPAKGKSKRGSRKKTTAQVGDAIRNPPEPPRTGVEIIEVEDRNGVNYHTMQDLRNNQKVHNVTRKSARRLWHYAIVQHEHGEPQLSEVLWHSEAPIGLWRRSDRAGATRSDLVSRQTDGSLRIFYGVTDDGLHGEWTELLKMAEEALYEGPEPAGGQ
jgi:hypothetical protein